MHRLFGKPGPPKKEAPTITDASTNIGTRLSDIDGKIKALDDEMRRYKVALKSNPGNANVKKRAMDCLKRKRMYEQQRDQFANQQFNLDQTQFAIETVKNTQESVAAMKVASKVLKKETKKLSLSEIEDMQDDMEDMLEDVGEINELLGRGYGCPEGVEEDDLDAELACLEDEMFAEDEEIGSAESTTAGASAYDFSSPSVPTSVVPSGTGALPDSVFNAPAQEANVI